MTADHAKISGYCCTANENQLQNKLADMVFEDIRSVDVIRGGRFRAVI